MTRLKQTLISLGLSLLTPWAMANSFDDGSFACITGFGLRPAAHSYVAETSGFTLQPALNSGLAASGLLEFSVTPTQMPSCQEVQEQAQGWQTVAFYVSAVSYSLACTGAGAPLSAAVGVGGLALAYYSMQVANLPCQDLATQELIDQRVKEISCSVLRQAGIGCQPEKTVIEVDIISENGI